MNRSKYYRLYKSNLRHARRQQKRKIVFKKYKKSKNRNNQGTPLERQKELNAQRDKFWGYKKESAPKNFSLIQNPEETIAFIKRLFSHYRKGDKVYVHLRPVTTLTNDAIAVLIAVMTLFRSAKLNFNGDYPRNEEVAAALWRSGFFSNLYNKIPDRDRYRFVGKENNLHTHADKNVDPELSDKIIEKASTTVWGEQRRCLGLQRVFMELMQNTNNHASLGHEGEKHWWVSVDQNEEKRLVSFAFIDFGVGIFNSLENKPEGSKFFGWVDKMRKIFSFSNNAELLRLILQGALHKTVTGKYYRGNGLPGIKNSFDNGSVSRLHIISNDVFADIENDKFIVLKNGLLGTLFYWELNEKNHNLPW